MMKCRIAKIIIQYIIFYSIMRCAERMMKDYTVYTVCPLNVHNCALDLPKIFVKGFQGYHEGKCQMKKNQRH